MQIDSHGDPCHTIGICVFEGAGPGGKGGTAKPDADHEKDEDWI